MFQNIIIYIFTIILLFLSACKDSNNELQQTLRSNINNSYYEQNNQEATLRLESIAYNKTNITNIYERFKIVHISDPHLSNYSQDNHYLNPINFIQSIRFANQPELKINAITVTGDLISNEEKQKALKYMNSFYSYFKKDNNIPSFICTGNHDSNMIENVSKNSISREEIHSILFSKLINTDKNYFYSDIPNPQGGTIRFISLDMLDQPKTDYNTLFYAYFSQEQINWLGNIALKKDITTKHSIIILTHYPFQPFSSNAYTYLCDGDFVHSWSMIPEIIEAYRSRSCIKKTYINKITKSPDLSVNFDFSNSSGEFICYLGGHAHFTTNFNIEGFDNENKNLISQKMLLCTNQSPSEIGTVYNKVKREFGTKTSNSFCLYAIDTKEKKIYITFFGAYKPSDDPDYPNIQTLTYF